MAAAVDARDWRVVDGYLEATPIALDLASPYHRLAADLADRLVAAFPEVATVLLAGSAAVPPEGEPPRDLDLAAVLADGVAPRAGLAAQLQDRIAPASALPIDLVVLAGAALRADPGRSLTTALRSVVVAGPPVWAVPVRLPARAVAVAEWRRRRDELRRHLAELLRLLERGPGPASDPDLVIRVQKRALRLIAPVALARCGRYSIALARCAELFGDLVPAAASLAVAVARDVSADAHDLDAVNRAVDLAIAILACERLVGAG